jgi:hypothetical protein
VSQRQKQVTNEKRARRLGTGEGIARNKGRGGGGSGGGIPGWAWIAGTVVLVCVGAAALAAVVFTDSGSGGSGNGTRTAVVLDRLSDRRIDLVSEGTWQPNYDDLGQAIEDLDLPGLSEVIEHYHAHLRVVVDGQDVVVPANIAIDAATQTAAPIHTHDERGVIHVEADQEGFRGTIQNVFDLWGVKLDHQCLGGFCDGVEIYVNGEQINDLNYHLEQHDAVTVVAGNVPDSFKPDESFDFEPGE